MNCKTCNYKIKKNTKFCPNCSSKIEDIEIKSDGKEPKYIIIFFLSLFLMIFLPNLSIYLYLIALIFITDAFNKYPKNKFVKFLFWGFLILTVLFIILAIVGLYLIYDQFVNGCRNFQ